MGNLERKWYSPTGTHQCRANKDMYIRANENISPNLQFPEMWGHVSSLFEEAR